TIVARARLWAMLLRAIAPMVLAHLAVTRRLGHGIVPTLVFVAGYLAVWSAIGAVALLVYNAFAPIDEAAALLRCLPSLAGTILIIAGAYQFSAWKRLCL